MAFKSEIRKLALENRKNWSNENYVNKNMAVCLYLLEFLKQYSPNTQVMSFKSMEHLREIDLASVHSQLIHPPYSFFLGYPRVSGEHIVAYQSHPMTLFEKSSWGILEPEENPNNLLDPSTIDLVLIPLLAIDLHGHRVGYGKGFYDRYLAHVSEQTIKVGVGFEDPISPIDDINSFDVPMDYLITPSGVISFP